MTIFFQQHHFPNLKETEIATDSFQICILIKGTFWKSLTCIIMIYCAFVFLQTKFFTFCGNDERLCVCRKSWFAWRGMLEVFQGLPTIFFHHIRTKQILVSEYLLSPLFYYNCVQCTYIFKVKFEQYKQVVFYTLSVGNKGYQSGYFE